LEDSLFNILRFKKEKTSELKEPGIGLPLEGEKPALLLMGKDLLAARSLCSLDIHRLFTLPTMAKQKVLPFG
jgi:hypothetical protein